MTFNLPPLLPGEPLDAMQKLAYAGVVFVLAPFQILTGAAQSPAIEARFPWYRAASVFDQFKYDSMGVFEGQD